MNAPYAMSLLFSIYEIQFLMGQISPCPNNTEY